MMRKSFKPVYCKTALAIGLLLGHSWQAATAETMDESAVKVAFMYNFIKFIEWPSSALSQATFNLCITENNALGERPLVLQDKKVREATISIHFISRHNDLSNCHMLFIAEDVDAYIRRIKHRPIATVSDKLNFIRQGGMLGLVRDDSRLGFEVNLNAARAAELHISAQLLKLAKTIKSD